MKTSLLVPAIVLFICCTEFHSAKGNPKTQEELPKKAEVVAKEQTPEKALEEPTKKQKRLNPKRQTTPSRKGRGLSSSAANSRTISSPSRAPSSAIARATGWRRVCVWTGR